MRYLGLDLGTKTLGISISDKTGIIATSLTTIRHDDDFNYLTKELKKIIEEREVLSCLYCSLNSSSSCFKCCGCKQ